MIKGNLIKNIKYIKTNMNVIKRWNIMSSDGSDFSAIFYPVYEEQTKKKNAQKQRKKEKKTNDIFTLLIGIPFLLILFGIIFYMIYYYLFIQFDLLLIFILTLGLSIFLWKVTH